MLVVVTTSLRRRRAFSFIEMMFVVVILGILVSVTLPRLTGGGAGTALRTTSRDLATAAALARQTAISRQLPVTITLNREHNAWWVDLPWPNDREWVREQEKLARRRGSSMSLRDIEERLVRTDEEDSNFLHSALTFDEILINDEEVRDEQIVITFYPSGSSSGAMIILATNKDKKMTVYIERATGLAMATRGEPKDFAAILEEEGLDPSKYAGIESTADLHDEDGSRPGEGFSRIAGSEDERVNYYQDVAARIMGQARQRQQQQEQGAAPSNNNSIAPRYRQQGNQ